MKRTITALIKHERESCEIIWGCLQENADYRRDCEKEYAKGRQRIPFDIEAYGPPHTYFLQKYGIAYPIDPALPFSNEYGEVITLFLLKRYVNDRTMLRYDKELDTASFERLNASLRKVVRRDHNLILEVDLSAKKETLIKEIGDLIDRYQKDLKETPQDPKAKGAEIKAARKRLRAFKLYKQLKSYRKTASKMVEEKFFQQSYVTDYPECAERDVIKFVKEGKELIDGGYRKLR